MVRERSLSGGSVSGNVGAHLLKSKDDYFSTENPEEIFDMMQEVGHGAFGSVYKAKDKRTGEIIAVKKMTVSKGRNSDEEWIEILKEISFMKSCDHENICKFKGSYLKGNTVYLAMEYCIGTATDIIDVLKDREPLSEIEIAALIGEVIKALHYLHNSKKIHRDIKGNNILLTEDGKVRVGDFGSASMNDTATTFIGTPYWMAPEVILAMETGTYMAKADVWSLGITCIELADKRPPLYEMHAMSALYHIPQNDAPTVSSTGWSDTFKSFLSQCLYKDPTKRASTADLLQHPFITQPKSDKVLSDLVNRSRVYVSEMDSKLYQELRSMLLLDEDGIDADAKKSGLLSPNDGKGKVATSPSIEDMRVNFGTLRPRSLMAPNSQMDERDLVRQQLKELTRLKKKHQIQLDILQKTHETEQLEARTQYQVDLEALVKVQEEQREKLRIRQRGELESLAKEHLLEERKEIEAIKEFHATEFKNYQKEQKSDLKEKHNKANEATPKPERKKFSVPEEQVELENKIREEQRVALEKKMKKFKSTLIEKRHALEMAHLVEEHPVVREHRNAQWELKRVLQQKLRDMRLQQLKKVHELKESQQSMQQKMEWESMNDFHVKNEREVKKRQYLEIKQRPKEIRDLEIAMKKKYEESVKKERKEFRASMKKLSETLTGKEEEEALKLLKNNHMITLQNMSAEYDKGLSEMLLQSNVDFDTKIKEQNLQLTKKHEEAIKSLKMFQNQRKDRVHLRHLAELDELKALLLKKQDEIDRQIMEMLANVDKEYETKTQELQDTQKAELDQHMLNYKLEQPKD